MTPVFGQGGGAGAEFQVGKVEINFQQSPMIQGGSYNKSGGNRAAQWLEIEVPFVWASKDATQKSIDDYSINYFVLIKNTKQQPKGTLLTGDVAHIDLLPGRDNKRSVMYVSPSSMAKMFEGKVPTVMNQVVAGVGIEIVVKGQVVAAATTTGLVDWWKDASQYDVVSGVLLDKSKTPFAPLAWDYYEPIKNSR